MGRRQDNDTMSSFLKTVTFPIPQDLAELFSGSQSEEISSTGRKIIDSIAMYDIATRILSKLPNYSRCTTEVIAVSSIVAPQQFILQKPKHCSFIESAFVSAAKNFENDTLTVEIPKQF